MARIRQGLPNNVRDARALRRRETATERALWAQVRGRQLDGRKFRRQHAIRNYVVDFYCAESRLIVEIDGGVHSGEQLVRDGNREEFLEGMGYRVLQLPAGLVESDIEQALEKIRGAL